jgi:hypothetical protein
MLVAAILLLALAYVAKAAVDILTHQEGNNIFEAWGTWFDARSSWKRKYKDYDAGDLRPRFWLSTTVLVFATDFWHAADSVYLTAYLAGGALLGCWLAHSGPLAWLLALAAVKTGGGAVFQACYMLFRIK